MAIRCFAAAAMATLAFVQIQPPAPSAPAARSPTPVAADGDKASIETFLRAYVDAFNKKDLKAMAAMWSTGATYVNRDDGDRSEGRAAIEADLAASMKNHPTARLSGSLTHVRFVK